ncbi:MAG: hypothetical protein ACLQNV_15805, partial [Steroidobacteraceae bacterium]
MLSSLAVTRRSRCPVIRHGLKAALLLGVPGFVWAQASPFMTGATSLQTKTFGRANGSSATSAIAYRAGERIRDERTGKVYDHTVRQGVMH